MSSYSLSVAILPFKNLSKDLHLSFYWFSLADAVITELARVRSLLVSPSSAILKYQGTTVDPSTVGRELNVHAILSSSFLRAGERLRVTSQLLDVRNGQLLWSDRIDAEANDIIVVQDVIAQRIVEGLRLELSPSEEVDIAKPATNSAEAYEGYLRGRDSWARFNYRTVARSDVDQAIEHFERAKYIDPSFALAHSGLGAAYLSRAMKGFGGSNDYAHAH